MNAQDRAQFAHVDKRFDGIERTQGQDHEMLIEDHDMLTELHTRFCKNGVLKMVCDHTDRIKALEDRHIGENAADRAMTGRSKKKLEHKRVLRDWLRLGIAAGVPTLIFLFDKLF